MNHKRKLRDIPGVLMLSDDSAGGDSFLTSPNSFNILGGDFSPAISG